MIFLWGYIKSKVYETRPYDLPTIKERNKNACASVTPDILSDVGQACVERWFDCYEHGGAHIECTTLDLWDEHFTSKMVPQIFSVHVDFIQ